MSQPLLTIQPSPTQHRGRVRLDYEVTSYPPDWLIEDEEQVPESRPHDLRADRLRQLLLGWKQRTGRDVQIGRNIALRWDEQNPRVGVDPDVYVVEPPPPEGDELMSIRTWATGHAPPLLAVEIVSPSRPEKDYGQSPQKYAASGAFELWIFDPNLKGPTAHGGPFRLQMWRRDEDDHFSRVYAGEGPMYSEAVGGWVLATKEGWELTIADDAQGTRPWMTPEEQERAEKEKALKRVAELEALLRDRNQS